MGSNPLLSPGNRHSAVSLQDFVALRDKGGADPHGEVRLRGDGLYVASDGYAGRKAKALTALLPGERAARREALAAFRTALIDRFGEQEGETLFSVVREGRPNRLDLKDLDRIWSKLADAVRTDTPVQEASTSASRGITEPEGGYGRSFDNYRAQLAELQKTPEGREAADRMASRLGRVAEDPRLLVLLANHHPEITDRLVNNVLTSPKFFAKYLPAVGTGIKIHDSVMQRREFLAMKSLREHYADVRTPLLSAAIDALEDRSRVKSAKNAVSAGMDVLTKALTPLTGGLAALAEEAGSAVVGEFFGAATGKAAEMVPSTVAGRAGTTIAEKGADSRNDKARVDNRQLVGFGENVNKLSDYRTVRALLAYLGPADQTNAIKNDPTIKDESLRAKLLDQEEARLALKAELGSPPDEDLSRLERRTEADNRFLDELPKRGKTKEGGYTYRQVRDIGGTEGEPSVLRALWMLEGWIVDDTKFNQAADWARRQGHEVVDAVRVGVSRTDRYQKLEDE